MTNNNLDTLIRLEMSHLNKNLNFVSMLVDIQYYMKSDNVTPMELLKDIKWLITNTDNDKERNDYILIKTMLEKMSYELKGDNPYE